MSRLAETVRRVKEESLRESVSKPIATTIVANKTPMAHHLTATEKAVLVELRIIRERFCTGRTGPALSRALTWLSQEVAKGNVDLE